MEGGLNLVPALKGLFLFPKTGVNAVNLGWTFMPGSGLHKAMGNHAKIMKAVTSEAKLEALKLHGINEYSESAFQALKAEYIGRQLMGSAVVMGLGLMAANGNVTGSGPHDAGQRRRKIEMGWKPYSIRNPMTGEWRSYQGIEPFDTLMGLVADTVYQADRLDQDVTEDMFRKIGFAITSNIANKTFLSGLEPLTALIGVNDEAAWERFFANEASSMVPGRGVISILNNTMTPQLKDVERNFLGILANKHKFLFQDEAILQDYKDFYTGKPVNGAGSMIEAINRSLPVMRSSGGTEPWRRWLLQQDWDGLTVINSNPNMPGEEMTPQQRQFVHDFVGRNNLIVPEIEKLMNNPATAEMAAKYAAKRRAEGLTNAEAPLDKLYIHERLDKIHRDAIKKGWAAWKQLHPDSEFVKAGSSRRDMYLGEGRVQEGIDEAKKLKDLKAILDY